MNADILIQLGIGLVSALLGWFAHRRFGKTSPASSSPQLPLAFMHPTVQQMTNNPFASHPILAWLLQQYGRQIEQALLDWINQLIGIKLPPQQSKTPTT